MVFALILALAFSIVAVVFALQNPTIVTVSLFGYPFEGSLALVILTAVGLGVVIGILVLAPGNIRNKLANSRNRKKIGSLEASLDEHKSKLASMEKPATAPKSDAEKKKAS